MFLFKIRKISFLKKIVNPNISLYSLKKNYKQNVSYYFLNYYDLFQAPSYSLVGSVHNNTKSIYSLLDVEELTNRLKRGRAEFRLKFSKLKKQNTPVFRKQINYSLLFKSLLTSDLITSSFFHFKKTKIKKTKIKKTKIKKTKIKNLKIFILFTLFQTCTNFFFYLDLLLVFFWKTITTNLNTKFFNNLKLILRRNLQTSKKQKTNSLKLNPYLFLNNTHIRSVVSTLYNFNDYGFTYFFSQKFTLRRKKKTKTKNSNIKNLFTRLRSVLEFKLSCGIKKKTTYNSKILKIFLKSSSLKKQKPTHLISNSKNLHNYVGWKFTKFQLLKKKLNTKENKLNVFSNKIFKNICQFFSITNLNRSTFFKNYKFTFKDMKILDYFLEENSRDRFIKKCEVGSVEYKVFKSGFDFAVSEDTNKYNIQYNIFFLKNRKYGLISEYVYSSIVSVFNYLKLLNSKDNTVNFNLNSTTLCLFSINNINLIFSNIGIFIFRQYLYKNDLLHYFTKKYPLKKMFYSFIYPNEYKRFILKRKRSKIVSRFFYKHVVFDKKHNPQSAKFLRTFFTFASFYFKKPITVGSNFSWNYANSSLLFFCEQDMKTKSSFIGKLSDEITIPRVRFKPGYQRLWRQVRSAYKEINDLKFKYQHRLTSYIAKFSRRTHGFFLDYKDIFAMRVIIHSYLLPDLKTIEFFQQHKLIYLNGSFLKSLNVIVFVGDLIQFIITTWYYIFFRWVSNWTILKLKKFKKLVYRKRVASIGKSTNTKKQKSKYTPNWILDTQLDGANIKHYLEIDYFTLSVMLVYEPYTLNKIKLHDTFLHRNSIYRLYNWKYTT